MLIWWGHTLLVLSVIALLPYGRRVHLLEIPVSVALQPERPMGVLEPISMAEVEETGKIGLTELADLDFWQRLSLDGCMECGRCTEVCPAHAVGKELNPKAIVLDIRRHLEGQKSVPLDFLTDEALWACTNCHADMLTYARYAVGSVTFASGVTLTSGDNDTNLCMTCHQGRESTASVNKAIEGGAPDAPNPKLAFVHVHYFPAGAVLYGTVARVGYEYAGKTYAGRFEHVPGVNTCTACHEPHQGKIRAEKCASCHQGGRPEAAARAIAGQKRDLYAAIQRYARAVGGAAIAFSPEAHPYWYTDVNGNGQVDPEELNPGNAYKAYTLSTPRMS